MIYNTKKQCDKLITKLITIYTKVVVIIIKHNLWVNGVIVEVVTQGILSIERITLAFTSALLRVYPHQRIVDEHVYVCIPTLTMLNVAMVH